MRKQKIIQIDRSKPFDPNIFIDEGWSIVEQDKRALAITEIDLTKVILDTSLEKGEKSIMGENRLMRLKEKEVTRLDAAIFKALWENKQLIPGKWKRKKGIFFDGSIFQSPFNDVRYNIYLYFYDYKWNWYYYRLFNDFDASRPSAVL